MTKLTLRVKSLKQLDAKELTRVVGGCRLISNGSGKGTTCPCTN